MGNFVLLAISLLIGSGICKPTDSDYSRYTYLVDVDNSSQQESVSIEWSAPEDDFVISKRELVVTKDNATASLTSQQTILLTDIIARVEGSLVHTAFDIVSLLKISNQTHTEEGDSPTGSSQVLEKKIEESPVIPLFENISSKTVPASSDKPIHVSIDRVTVYVANSDNFPLIPTFKLPGHKQDNRKSEEAEEKTITDKVKTEEPDLPPSSVQKRSISSTPLTTTSSIYSISGADQKSLPAAINTASTIGSTAQVPLTAKYGFSTEPIKDSSIHQASTLSSTSSSQVTPSSSTPGASSTSTPLSTSATTTTIATSTSKNPVKELKETEEELKEKVAEIQADPVILSSRI